MACTEVIDGNGGSTQLQSKHIRPVLHQISTPHRTWTDNIRDILNLSLGIYISMMREVRNRLPHSVFSTLSCIRIQWFLQLTRSKTDTTTVTRGLRDLLRACEVPTEYPLAYHLHDDAVYLKISHIRRGTLDPLHTTSWNGTYPGTANSTSSSLGHRHSSPAFRVCHSARSHQSGESHLHAMEQALNSKFHPQLNAPFVYTLIKNLGHRLRRLHTQRYILTQIVNCVGSNGDLKFFAQRLFSSVKRAYILYLADASVLDLYRRTPQNPSTCMPKPHFEIAEW